MTLIVGDAVLAHSILGYEFEQNNKIVRLMAVLRRLWPLWMYDPSEANPILRVLSECRPSHPLFTKVLQLVSSAGERYRECVTKQGLLLVVQLLKDCEGNVLELRKTTDAWTREEILLFAGNLLELCFLENPILLKGFDIQDKYAEYVKASINIWISIAEEKQLYKSFPTSVNATELQKYSQDLWTKRLHPPTDEIEVICTHIDTFERYIGLSNLRSPIL